MSFPDKKGFSIMEVLLSGALFSLFATVFIGSAIYGQQTAVSNSSHMRAVFIAEEGLEIVRNIRDAEFSYLIDGTFGILKQGSAWALSGTSDTVEIFTRSISILTIDNKTKQVDATITWPASLQRTGTFTLTTYLTNWAAETLMNWTLPFIQSTLNISGNHNAQKVQTQGNYAYLIRDGGSPNFFSIDITNASAPLIAGSLTLDGTVKNIEIQGNYAFVTSANNSAELQIISLSDPSNPAVVGIYNASGTADGEGIAVSESYAYLGRSASKNPELEIIDITNPANPILAGSLELGDTVNDLAADGNYLYIAGKNNNAELQIVSLLDPHEPVLAGQYDISGNEEGTAIAIKNASAILLGSTDNTLSIIDSSIPASPTLTSSFSVNGTPADIVYAETHTYAFLVTKGANTFQIIDISAPASPSPVANMSMTSTPAGIAYSSLDRVLLATEDNTDELIIIAPQ